MSLEVKNVDSGSSYGPLQMMAPDDLIGCVGTNFRQQMLVVLEMIERLNLGSRPPLPIRHHALLLADAIAETSGVSQKATVSTTVYVDQHGVQGMGCPVRT